MVSKTLTLVVCFIALGMINAAEEKHDHYHHDHHEDFDSRHHVDHDLHCFSCNENYDACRYPFDDHMLENNYIVCAGQCMKFRNPADGHKWYRGCSNERFNGPQHHVVHKDGITYYFCNHNGCNIY